MSKQKTKAGPPAPAAEAQHRHQVPGVGKPSSPAGKASKPSSAPKPAAAGLMGLAAATKGSTKKKEHIINISEYAEQLRELQTVNANIKSLETRKAEVQSELYPAIEERRKALCKNLMEYIGSVKVTAGDESGVGTYFIKNQWSGLNPADANQMASAIEVVMSALGLDEEAATAWINSNLKMKTEVSFTEEALDNPEVIAIIQEQLGPYVTVKMQMIPSKTLSESASYDDEASAVIDGLEAARLVSRYSAVLKPAGKPS